uniref:Uncharacterized protein n=1 Tax=Arundo donax TaxID=35708 RepID=A0A0A9LLQ7_ARUDO
MCCRNLLQHLQTQIPFLHKVLILYHLQVQLIFLLHDHTLLKSP